MRALVLFCWRLFRCRRSRRHTLLLLLACILVITLQIGMIIGLHRSTNNITKATLPTNMYFSGWIVWKLFGTGIEEKQQLSQLSQYIPSLPDLYQRDGIEDTIMEQASQCPEYPLLTSLHFSNFYWQTIYLQEATRFYVYSAYYDPSTRIIRILAMITKPPKYLTCALWANDVNFSTKVPVLSYQYLWKTEWGEAKEDQLKPYFIVCEAPEDLIPKSVSLIGYKCTMNGNNIKVHAIESQPNKKDFAVCLKGLHVTSDVKYVLIEWLEILYVFGVYDIYVYIFHAPDDILSILQHYQKQGHLHIVPISLPGHQPNLPPLLQQYFLMKMKTKRFHEVLFYNDCFYRNKGSHQYVVPLDMDEVIVPKFVENWKQLVNQQEYTGSLCFESMYFFEEEGRDVSSERYPKLQTTRRSGTYVQGMYQKCFQDTRSVEAVHNHQPLKCQGFTCPVKTVNLEEAQLHHYRRDCVVDFAFTCNTTFKNNLIEDLSLSRFKTIIIEKVDKSLKQITEESFFKNKPYF